METLQAIGGERPEAVELGDVKQHLRVDFGSDDAAIRGLMAAATDYLEQWCGRSFIHQQLRLSRSCWPDCATLELRRPPLASVEAVEYFAPGGASLTLFDPANYYVVRDDSVDGAILLKADVEWPEIDERPDAVQVRYTSGYAASSVGVPARAKQAIMLVVGHWYANREAASERSVREIDQGLRALMGTLWTGNVAGARFG